MTVLCSKFFFCFVSVDHVKGVGSGCPMGNVNTDVAEEIMCKVTWCKKMYISKSFIFLIKAISANLYE